MRILIVSQYFWPESFRINDLALALTQKGHDVKVLTGLPNYPSGAFFPGYGLKGPWSEHMEGVPVKRVPLVPRGWSLGINFASFALFASLFGPARLRDDFDVIFAYEPSPITVGLPAIVFRRVKKAPMILWVQDIWPDVLLATGAVKSKTVLSLLSRLTSWIYSRCDHILVSSEAFTPLIKAAGAGHPRVGYLPNWAESFYRPMVLDESAKERREVPGGFCIMYAGSLGASQALDTILGAAEKLREHPDLHWVMLGEGRMSAWLAAEVKQRGLQKSVHLLGRRPVETMPRYFALADALLVSLKADPVYQWTVPAKLQSYMACGKPVLGTLAGEGARIIEQSGSGLVAKAEDPGSLAEAALSLMNMPASKRQELGKNGLDYFKQHFERAKVIGDLEKTLQIVARSQS